MRVTAHHVAEKLGAFLRHEMPLDELVDWAEREMMDGEFASDAVRDAVARLGVADVREFGLTWEDCTRILRDLGYTANVSIDAA